MRVLLLLLAVFGGFWASAAQARDQHISASLVASTLQPRPGSTITLGLRFRPEAGWHGYWTNPGDSGLPPKVNWSAPADLSFGPLQHPAPTILSVAGITSYVHAGEHVLLSRVRVPANLEPGTRLPIQAAVNWLACSESLCVPERATLQTELVIGDGSPGKEAQLLERARSRLPRSIGLPAPFIVEGNKVRLLIPANIGINPGRARFFPDENGYLSAAAIRPSDGDELVGTTQGSLPGVISGVLSDGAKAYRLHFDKTAASAVEEATNKAGQLPPQVGEPSDAAAQERAGELPRNAASVRSPVPTIPEAPPSAASVTSAVLGGTLLLALGGAVVGGLLLNLMPCVFPILSLKALHLATSGASEGEARRDALGYAAGAIAGCGGLGLVLVLLRAGGMEIGWSFQLQNPLVILALLLLVVAIALNLAGLYEVRGPALTQSSKPHGAFASGLLAAAIATPCSGPFMAAALGAALVLPAAAALIVFAGLGLGLALPYIFIAFVPAIRTRLPRPGEWMVTLRRLLALPMLLTAVGLLWLLGRQGGAEEMTKALLLSLLLGVALWWLGLRQRRGSERSTLVLAPALTVLALAMILSPPQLAAQAAQASPAAGVEPFSEARLSELRREGRPVFVDFTADWCLTCKVNEKMAIDRAETHEAFRKAGIVTLEGDWTRGDPAITRFLEKHGRNSIPFYLFYPPGKPPKVLPQILTPGMLRDLARASEPATPRPGTLP